MPAPTFQRRCSWTIPFLNPLKQIVKSVSLRDATSSMYQFNRRRCRYCLVSLQCHELRLKFKSNGYEQEKEVYLVDDWSCLACSESKNS
jgi:hypothetical protein